MHETWDGHEELTFLLPPSQMTLPRAQYKQSAPLPHGMSEAEVKYFKPKSSNHMNHMSLASCL